MKYHCREITTLGAFLQHSLPDAPSKRAVKRLLDSGSVSLNKKVERFYSQTIFPGDIITIQQRLSSSQEFLSQRILFQEEEFLVYNKPVGLSLSSPEFLADLTSRSLRFVHRLDKDTSGLLLLAKTPSMQKKLENLFRHRTIQKTYYALVHARMQKRTETLNLPIGLLFTEGTAKRYGISKNGRPAITHIERVELFKDTTLVKLIPETGRTHQLRVHLKAIGHPIVGDILYGRQDQQARLFLHARHLSFRHPDTQELLEFTSPLPSQFYPKERIKPQK